MEGSRGGQAGQWDAGRLVWHAREEVAARRARLMRGRGGLQAHLWEPQARRAAGVPAAGSLRQTGQHRCRTSGLSQTVTWRVRTSVTTRACEASTVDQCGHWDQEMGRACSRSPREGSQTPGLPIALYRSCLCMEGTPNMWTNELG